MFLCGSFISSQQIGQLSTTDSESLTPSLVLSGVGWIFGNVESFAIFVDEVVVIWGLNDFLLFFLSLCFLLLDGMIMYGVWKKLLSIKLSGNNKAAKIIFKV